MEVQPQLVLLQKTLLNIEGLGRQLYPDLDLWETAKPFLEEWVVGRRGPKALAKKFVDQAPLILDAMPHMPMLVHDYLQGKKAINEQSRQGFVSSTGSPDGFKLLRYCIAGFALILSAALIASAHVAIPTSAPWWTWLLGGVGFLCLLRGLFGRSG